MRMYRVLAAAILAALTGCSASMADYWPDTQWRTSTPEAQGVDSTAILAMLQEIQKEELTVHSVLIVRHGYLVAEVYFPPYTREIKHPLHSISKSVTSAMTGVAVREGWIQSVRQKVLDFFPEIAGATQDEYLKELTVEHLLTMSAGFNTSTLPNLEGRDAEFDSIEYILTHSNVLRKPGATFFYDSGLPHVMSAILQKTSGQSLETNARAQLFDPLGISDYQWSSDPQGITTGYSGLSLCPRDMAKWGYLYLHKGRWDGEQIIPADWVRDSTAKRMDTRGLMNAAEEDGYGYYWWADSFGGFSAHGHGGQYIFVLPGLDMVVVFTGSLADSVFPAPHRLLQTFLLPAAQSTQPLEENPQAFSRLTAEIRSIENPEQPAAPLPEIAGLISGRTFRIRGEGFAGWPEKISFTFPGGNTYQSERINSAGTMKLTGGLNNVFYINRLGLEGEILSPLKGSWLDDHTFVEKQNLDLFGNIQFFTVTYTFEGLKMFLRLETSMDYFPAREATGEIIE